MMLATSYPCMPLARAAILNHGAMKPSLRCAAMQVLLLGWQPGKTGSQTGLWIMHTPAALGLTGQPNADGAGSNCCPSVVQLPTSSSTCVPLFLEGVLVGGGVDWEANSYCRRMVGTCYSLFQVGCATGM